MNIVECDSGLPALRLEPQTAAHAEEMFAVLSDPAIYEFENDPPESLEWLRSRFARLESRQSGDGGEGWLNWVIRFASGDPVGFVQATVRSDGCASVAYVLNSAYWGRGIASRAVRCMISELVGTYGVRRLEAVLKRENRRSMRLLERLGFANAPPDTDAFRALEQDEIAMVLELGNVDV